MLNRSVVTVRAKQPFLDWLRSLPDKCDLTLDLINRDPNAYLLPSIFYPNEESAMLREFYHLIFEDWLDGYWRNEAHWPQVRTLDVFREWFDVEFHSEVMDLVDDLPLEDDD